MSIVCPVFGTNEHICIYSYRLVFGGLYVNIFIYAFVVESFKRRKEKTKVYFTEENLLSMVNTATDKFNFNERYLIENDLSERCICARFAMYLQNELSDSKDYRQYVVDVEYNRGGERKRNNPKMLFNKKIVVDLIAHKRGFDGGNNNLICCEMKKSTDRRGSTDDEKRLR